MNTVNPFQIPECFQKADFHQRRRERFKRGVMAVVFAVMALLIVLLIQGCMSERAAVTLPSGIATTTVLTYPGKNLASNPSQGAGSTLNVSLASSAIPQKAVPAPQKAEIVYVVQPGDNLTHIARQHGTTIQAIKAANDLANDRIFVGNKLKIPQA